MNASIEIQNGVKTLSGAPVDAKYYNNVGTPYTNVAEVNSQIPSALRGRGLTVNVAGVEYWYKDGITDLDLVVKSSGTTDYSDLTNKPTINSVQLTGNKTAAELQLATKAQGDKADTALQSLPAGTVIDPNYTHTDNNYTDADVLEVAKIANKVDKVTGKSLISDTEITRLAAVVSYDDTNIQNEVAGKQPTLVSGTNIKTINNQSILGGGDIVIEGGGTGEPPAGGYANNLYFAEAASDVSGYETLSYTPEMAETIENWTVNSSEGEKILKNYLYPQAVAVDFIPAGIWSFQFFLAADTASSETKLGVTYFKRATNGTETNLFTMWSDEINNIAGEWVRFQKTLPNYDVDITDRMGVRVLAKTTHNTNVTLTYPVGDGYGAYLNNPNKIRHSQLRDLNGDANNLHVRLTDITNWDNKQPAGNYELATNKKTTLSDNSDTFYPTQKAVKTVTDLKRDKTEIGDAHGFVAPPNSGNFTVTGTAPNITFNLLSNAGAFKINGTTFAAQNLSLNLILALGQNFIVCTNNAGTPQLINLGNTPFTITSTAYTPVAIIGWDGVNYRVNDELHLASRNLIQHQKEHDTDGARWVSGFATTFGAAAANTFSAASGRIRDEERYHDIAAKTQAQIAYRNAAGTAMIYDAPSTRYAKLAGALPCYDNASGTPIALGNNNYGVMWMYATNAKLPTNGEIVFVMGQAVSSTIANAQTQAQPTLVGMAVAEWKLLYRVIIRQAGSALVYIQSDDLRLTTTGLAVSGGAGVGSTSAAGISFSPTGSIASTNVQAAIEGLDAEKKPMTYYGEFQDEFLNIADGNVTVALKKSMVLGLSGVAGADLTSANNVTFTLPTPIAGEFNQSVIYFKIGSTLPTINHPANTLILGTFVPNSFSTVIFTYDQIRTAASTWQRVLSVKKV